MNINLRWVGEEDYERLADVRLRCYASSANEREKFFTGIRADPRAQPGDFLLAESNGDAIGTTTSMSLNMWVRGGRIPCQGVAYVGTIRTQRRTGAAGSMGVATQLMHETLRMAREREMVASALMPFRASFYEHFGYGLAEQRVEWQVDNSLMPVGSADGMRYATDSDRDAIAECRQRFVERGQCDMETSLGGWVVRQRKEEDGFTIVDAADGTIRGWYTLVDEMHGERRCMRIVDPAWDSPAQLHRLLRFLGGQKDQYDSTILTLPPEIPLNRYLREPQLPHRPVVHAAAKARPYTRMQVRVLDHVKFLSAMKLPERWTGGITIDVRETELGNSRFDLQIDAGHVSARSSNASADVECSDVTWASIATGDLHWRAAADLGALKVNNPNAAEILDALADGPTPFCSEYF